MFALSIFLCISLFITPYLCLYLNFTFADFGLHVTLDESTCSGKMNNEQQQNTQNNQNNDCPLMSKVNNETTQLNMLTPRGDRFK